MKVAIQNGSFERDIPMCWERGRLSIKFDPNLSDHEKNVQLAKFSQEYKAKLEKLVQNEILYFTNCVLNKIRVYFILIIFRVNSW